MTTSAVTRTSGISRRRTPAVTVVAVLTLVSLPVLMSGATAEPSVARAQDSAPASVQDASVDTDFPPCC
ncbi:hypothetical protein ACFZCP_07815 [Streptomyces sp. NPDC007971]|uniref:hypothetical protein n=1 Tax=Streptomyces sp. NPDC007971 TaxID=3364799 RepID=UPI0036E07615